uniref:Cytochrome b5 heme-binding domain-containing protein n=1 Tax=Chromera velia CCMP2878 TaxID=1169474 RepID=A0A0G4FHR1_9ALVE|eukprot:Cvel_17069.t1-p1 / transcript=Cvel_17069.t1 / gene=Cvel_17069 / organism=Chromera_velia_CCMP2878 / gene_product=hypothetical protein / transcript_product=hypothetical protein / location=Cvel_scaffold1345:31107-39364(+) / protein_length=524 / sequence_SO=supercontig / SO=protein_coding / is_pseudo=false
MQSYLATMVNNGHATIKGCLGGACGSSGTDGGTTDGGGGTDGTTRECTASEPQPPADVIIDSKELATHNSAADCWQAIGCGVYDVTAYSHSGGQGFITAKCGKDAHASFSGKHPMTYLQAFMIQMVLDGVALFAFIIVPIICAYAAKYWFSVRWQDRWLRRPLAEPKKGAWGHTINGYLEMSWALFYLLVYYLVMTIVFMAVWAYHYLKYYPVGKVAVLFVLMHGLDYLIVFEGTLPETVAVSAWYLLITTIVVGVFTVPNIRVHWYGIFRVSHYLAPLIVIILLLHLAGLSAEGVLAPGFYLTIVWTAVAAGFWVFDYLQMSIDAYLYPVKVTEPPVLIPAEGDAAYVCFVVSKTTKLFWGCWMSVASTLAGSTLSHPFTTIVKKTGKEAGCPWLYVTGPFGGGLAAFGDLKYFSTMVFVSAGVGVTPVASMVPLFSGRKDKKVHVVWSFRSLGLFRRIAPYFQDIPAESCHFHYTMRKGKGENEAQQAEGSGGEWALSIKNGRPDLPAILRGVREQVSGDNK